MANDERSKQTPPLRLKKLFVMGAHLIEDYHELRFLAYYMMQNNICWNLTPSF
jgi:hypothetical protein